LADFRRALGREAAAMPAAAAKPERLERRQFVLQKIRN
jgi:hypothetical protein